MSGDRVQLRIFEPTRLKLAAAKEGVGPETALERLDLGGVYEIDGAGEVGLPLLGRMMVRGQTLPCIEAAVAMRFFEVSHGVASISATFATRPPIAITGAVRSPGSYVATPGMNLTALLAAAGAAASAGDQREVQDLSDRKAELERTSVGISLSLASAEAIAGGKTELSLDDTARRRILAIFGPKRLDIELELLRAAKAAELASSAATAALLVGFDNRIVSAELNLMEIQKQSNRLGDRVTELTSLQKKGVATLGRVQDIEFDSMSLERARLEAAKSLTDLRAARDTAAFQADLAAAERREGRQKQIADLVDQKAAVEAEIARIEARLSHQAIDTAPAEGLNELPVTVQRMTPEGSVDLRGEPAMPVLPGDVVLVGVDPRPRQEIAERPLPPPVEAAAAAFTGALTR